MGFVVDYLNSPRMAQELAKVMGSTNPDDLEYVNKQMTCALLRWQQLFENRYVDKKVLQMREPSYVDFINYHNELLFLFRRRNISEEKIQPKIDALLVDNAKKLLADGPDWQQRMVMLLTMGACEYHGFNAVFEDSIRKNGLNPHAKFHKGKQVEPIRQIFARVGLPYTMGNVKRDQNLIFVTPDPRVAYLHAKASPEWFYFFSSGNQYVNIAYLNRDYKEARNHLLKFAGHEDLTNDERVKIIEFFEYWWQRLATPLSPKIAVMPMFRDPAVLHNRLDFNLKFLQRFGYKKMLQNFLGGNMYVEYQHIYDQPIAPEFIQIVDVPTKEALVQRLSKLQDVFHQTDLRLQQGQNLIHNIQKQNSDHERAL